MDETRVQVQVWHYWLGSIANDKLKGQSILTTFPIRQFNTTGHLPRKKIKLVDFLPPSFEQLWSI